MDDNSKSRLQLPQTTCGTRLLADTRMIWVFCLGPVFALLMLAMPAFAQSMPENASAKSYGDGWEYNRTFENPKASAF